MTDSEADLRRNLATGQYERMNRMASAVLAKELGLDPTEFAQPFPGNQSITINNPPQITVHNPPQPVTSPKSRQGLSTAAAVAIGMLGASVPAVGVVSWLLATAKPAVQTIEKVIQKPGLNYDVEVDMEVIPPAK